MLACSDEKCNQCAQRGASNVINYKTEDFAEVVNSRTKVYITHLASTTFVSLLYDTCLLALSAVEGSGNPS